MGKNLDGVVAKVCKNGLLIVINKGFIAGVKMGMRYLIYNKGDEIYDPDTNEYLGTLEEVCGNGIVCHVQEKTATIKSCVRNASVSRIIRPKSLINGLAHIMPETEERAENIVPFEDVRIGSFARHLD